MNKRAIFIFGLIVLFFCTAYYTVKMQTIAEKSNIAGNEYNLLAEKNNAKTEAIATNAGKEKTTPNTELILKKIYTDCGHTISDSAEIPTEMVNLTEDEIKEKYNTWVLEEFTKDRVVLSKQVDSFCGEHYLVIEENEKINVYKLDEEENRSLQEQVDVEFQYLPETDKILLKNGIYVNGNEELNKIKEDYNEE